MPVVSSYPKSISTETAGELIRHLRASQMAYIAIIENVMQSTDDEKLRAKLAFDLLRFSAVMNLAERKSPSADRNVPVEALPDVSRKSEAELKLLRRPTGTEGTHDG